MYQISFDNPISVYFIGIGGISMSGLALVLADRGFKVTGSDRSESDATAELVKAGIKVHFGQKAENMAEGIKLAGEIIDSGEATKTLEKLIEVSNR